MKLTATQLRRIIAEEVSLVKTGGKDPQRFLHGFESGHPNDDEGYMVKSRMSDIKEMAETICGLVEMQDQMPAWVQDLIASAHTDLEHVKDYLANDEKLRNYDKPSMPGVAQLGKVRSESRHRGGMMLEGHNRITPAEMNAWMAGDWGFVSETAGDGIEMARDEAGETPDAQAEFDAALQKFASDMSGDVSYFEGDPEDIAPDLALDFFRVYPQWRKWASALGMSKADVQTVVVDSVYEASEVRRLTRHNA